MADTFSTIKNRGIGGDKVSDVLARLDEIIRAKPAQVFLLIGTNDIAKGIELEQTIAGIRSIIERTSSASPATAICLVSVLPVHEEMLAATQPAIGRNAKILALNQAIQREATAARNVQFLDVTPPFVDSAGNLKQNLTTDGLHLTTHGLLLLCEQLRPYIIPGQPLPQVIHPPEQDQTSDAGGKSSLLR